MGMIVVTGQLICRDEAEAGVVRQHLAEHVRLSRLEPGCLRFDVSAGPDPLCWQLDECFVDAAAFAVHQHRTQSSDWFRATAAIGRHFTRREV